MFEDDIHDPAFGQVELHVVSGNRNLFMVDYPQQHYVTLSIKKAALHRSCSNDYVFGKEEIVEIAFSETQWARMLTSMNSGGVPCTLLHYVDPKTGKGVAPRLPEKHAATKDTFAAEVNDKAKKTAANVAEALAEVEAMLAGGSAKKGDLQRIKEKLFHANMELALNLPFVVQQAEEAIETAVESGKAEVDAHVEFTLQRLGTQALGDRLAKALEDGIDPKSIGLALAQAVTTPGN